MPDDRSLPGGFHAFETAYQELCEDALMRPKNGDCDHPDPAPETLDGHPEGAPTPPGPENAIESAPVAQVLPFLYLGNAKDAQDSRVLEVSRGGECFPLRLRGIRTPGRSFARGPGLKAGIISSPLLQAHGIRRVLNVTSHAALPSDGLLRKSLPALDSAHQNLLQYFDEAIDYIGKTEGFPSGGARGGVKLALASYWKYLFPLGGACSVSPRLPSVSTRCHWLQSIGGVIRHFEGSGSMKTTASSHLR